MNKELYEKFMQVQWILRKQHMRNHERHNSPMADTTRGQGRILAALKLRDGISTKDLAYLLGVRVSSLNELILKLEKSGYVTREPSEQDKRIMLVKLTEKGKNEEQPETSFFGDVFSCLTEDEQKTLEGLLDRIIDTFQDNFVEDDDETFERFGAMRERFGNATFPPFPPFGDHRHDFRKNWGFMHEFFKHFAPGEDKEEKDDSDE